MKKTALLLLLVLGLSSTALGYCPVCVSVGPACPSCDDPVALSIEACVAGTCTAPCNVKVCVNPYTHIITVEVVANCTCACGCTPLTLSGGDLNLGTLPCGMYMVVVKVYRQCTDGCCGNPCGCKPVFCGMAMKSFKVVCDCCGCYPCRCMFCWPCWCCPTNNVD